MSGTSRFLIRCSLHLVITSLFYTLAIAEPMRIGVLTDLSGGMASWGRQTRLGAEIARDDIEKGGGGVQLSFGDHQLQAKSAVTEFQKLTDFDKIEACYSEFTPTTVAIAPIAASKHIPIIYAAAAVSPLATSPLIFKSYMDFTEGCRKVSEAFKRRGVKKLGFLKANFEFGDLCSQGISKVFSDPIEASFNPGQEVASQVIGLKSKGVDALMFVGFEPDFLHMLKAINDLSWRPLIGTQSDAVTSETSKLFPSLMSYITFFSLPNLPDDFLAKIKAKDPGNNLVSISAAGLAYLHIKQLYAAHVACGEANAECLVSHVAGAAADKMTGFLNWQNRVANFALSLHTWRDGQEVVINE